MRHRFYLREDNSRSIKYQGAIRPWGTLARRGRALLHAAHARPQGAAHRPGGVRADGADGGGARRIQARGRERADLQRSIRVRDEFGLDLAQSYMIGDKLIDLECGWNAGVKKSLLVRTGYGAELEKSSADKLAADTAATELEIKE